MTKPKTTGEIIGAIIGYIIGVALMGWWLDWALDHLVEKELPYWASCLAILGWGLFVPKSVGWVLGLGLAVSTFYIWFF